MPTSTSPHLYIASAPRAPLHQDLTDLKCTYKVLQSHDLSTVAFLIIPFSINDSFIYNKQLTIIYLFQVHIKLSFYTWKFSKVHRSSCSVDQLPEQKINFKFNTDIGCILLNSHLIIMTEAEIIQFSSMFWML